MGVLHGLADLGEQLKALVDREMLLVAVLGDWYAFHQVHHKIRPARFGGAGINDSRDIWVIHHRQRLALGFKTSYYLACIHARLNDFECDRALDRRGLFGHEYYAHAAFADLLQKLEGADEGAGPFTDRRVVIGRCIA
jgi:hypothetical protein